MGLLCDHVEHQYLAVKTAANTEAFSTSWQASGTKTSEEQNNNAEKTI
jgi:hypothetical protein